MVVKLVSMAGTGYFYTTTKNPSATRKLFLQKYDPVLRTHTLFRVRHRCLACAANLYLRTYLFVHFRVGGEDQPEQEEMKTKGTDVSMMCAKQ